MHSISFVPGIIPTKCQYGSEDEASEVVAMPSKGIHRGPFVKKWIFDSGCGVDLVSKRDVKGFEHKIRDAEEPLVFRTANGRTEAESTIKVPCKEIGCPVDAYVLQNTHQPLFPWARDAWKRGVRLCGHQANRHFSSTLKVKSGFSK
jgi:hypothetical protein